MPTPPQEPDTPGPGQFFPASLPPRRRARILMRYLDLTEAQAEIALHIAEGLTVKEIAALDGRRVTTVKGHLEQLKWRLRTRNGHQLAGLVLAVLWWHAERNRLSGGGG